MDKGQILRDYKAAKNHKRQIAIIAELNACSKEKIIEILTEGGYLRIFNTNGVDVSTKSDEITEKYRNGESVAALAKAYHVSLKGMKAILGIEETEENNAMEKAEEKATQDDKKLIEQLENKVNVLTKHNDELREQLNMVNALAENKNEELKALRTKYRALIEEYEHKISQENNEAYQQLCIKNNQLSTTIDVLIEKITMLKAVQRNE